MPHHAQDRLCLIGLAAADGVGAVTIARLQRAAATLGLPLSRLAAWPADRLRARVPLTAGAAGAVAAVGDPVRAGRALLARLDPLGIAAVLAGEAPYPADLSTCLGTQAPPVVFTAGDTSLLSRPRVAIVGSRRPSRRAAAAARDLAASLAAAGTSVVSGGADGIDMIAHRAAAAAGGTVSVPTLGLVRFRPAGIAPRDLGAEGWFALGQFPPESRWRTPHALMRNRTIVALSRAVVAFEPRDVGGTLHSSRWALRMRKPLFVATAVRRGARERGLRRLVRLGAVALDVDRMPAAAELARLIDEYRPPPYPDQVRLFDA